MSEEVKDISLKDVEETMEILKDVPNIAGISADVLRNISKKIEDGEFPMSKGLSFLHLKNLNMLNYISNMSYVILRKLNGKKVENDPAIQRLVELRVAMDKMRPIEDKLKYQMNKMLTAVNSQSVDTNDPLRFRANPESLDTQEEVEEEGEKEPEQQKQSKVYVPPKIAATYYDEDNMLDHKKKALEQAQKRALSSSMLYELRREYDAGPEEIKEMYDPCKIKISEEMKKREEYEEEYMLRLPMTKKQRHEMRQLTTVTNFNTKFDDISALEMRPDGMQLKKKPRGKKGKYKGKGKKKGAKRKH